MAASESESDNEERPNAPTGFVFDDESAYGGTLGKARGGGASWDFTSAIKVLADQGAKKPFMLLSEEHIATKRAEAKQRISMETKAKKKAAAVEKAKSGSAGSDDDAGPEVACVGDGAGMGQTGSAAEDADGNEDGGKDDEGEDEEDDDDDDDDDEDGDDDELGPAGDDELRDMGVTAAEAAAKERASRKQAREESRGGGGGDDGGSGGGGGTDVERAPTVDDDAAAADFFDTYASFLPSGGPEGGGGEGGDVLFSQLNLSRPLMRGVESMGFVRPTPIQVQQPPPRTVVSPLPRPLSPLWL